MELNATKKGKEKAEKIRCLDREQMKTIAAASMVCDHICMILLPGNPTAQVVRDTVGRFSFLIFLALFIDGFFYIKKENYGRHIRDLALCVLLSFPGYSYANTGTWCSVVGISSVMTEFLITFLLLVFLQSIRERTAADVILAFGASLLACVIDLALGVSYTVAGPIAAFAVWCLGERRSYAAECVAVTLSVLAATLYPWELFGAIPLVLYSGKKPKGKRKKTEKYFYYVFYPAHLALLGFIKAAAGI